MATTRIMPLHVGKGRTESRAISDIIDYVANPKKTDNGRLITGYACDSRTADAEFLLAKRQYIAATGRVRGADDVIAYHVRQSFRPGEITPEEANRLGMEFAKRFTKGNHAFVVCTHIDKSHIHNHIIWSSVSLEYDRKFRNFWGSTKAVRRLSDTICIENGLSIVENPKPHGISVSRLAPSACNRQPQRIIVVREPENLSKVQKAYKLFGSTCVLIVCRDRRNELVRPFDNKCSGDLDIGIVCDHIMLAARELGIGSVMVGLFDPAIIRKEFDLPEYIEPTALLILGYPTNGFLSPDRHQTERKPLCDTVMFECYSEK